jgi:hypothetical protein
MQEWEAFFVEKSRRRSRARKLRNFGGWMLAATALLATTTAVLSVLQSP